MDKEFYQILATVVTTIASIFAIMHSLKKDIRRLSAKIDYVDDKLSSKIDYVDDKLSAKIDDIKDRVIYIEACLDLTGKTASRDRKPVKPRKPRAKKTAQITMKDTTD